MTVSADSPVTALSGIGTKKAALYEKLSITTVRQLLLHLPRSYLDLRKAVSPDEVPLGDSSPHLVFAKIVSKSREQRIRGGLSLFHVMAVSGDCDLLLTFYNTRFTVGTLHIGEEVWLYGPVGGTLLRREMKAPAIVPPGLAGTLAPVYPGVEGLSSRVIAKDIRTALKQLDAPLTDCVPDQNAAGLPSLWRAVQAVHRPSQEEELSAAHSRIVLGELLAYSTAMLLLRGMRNTKHIEPIHVSDPEPFLNSLPYSPTKAQLRAIEEIRCDLCSGRVMSRLVQGDVGSGKTVIAAAAIWMAAKNGLQSALMAPTEILAEQHLRTFQALFAPFGLRVGMLTGSSPAKERRQTSQLAAEGKIDLLIGTHALFQSEVNFQNLGLAVTDEQHRFGVAQRTALSAKGSCVHTLVMSATPIPRTLSLILYGDLDVSVVDELPAGRKSVSTYCIDSGKRPRAFAFLRQHLDAGRQAYIVCPLVEENDSAGDLRAAAQYADSLSFGEFSGYCVGLLHGRMKPDEKETVMRRFLSGEIQLLVATTVIEVGVDVPNAVVMLIENAERFGLSQLHQLRGRVGRGAEQSFCILVSDAKGDAAQKRLSVIKSTTDGFRIAEEDLRLRGPGELLGIRQSGMPGLPLGSDPSLLLKARETAADILQRDPALSWPAHSLLKEKTEKILKQIGMLPN